MRPPPSNVLDSTDKPGAVWQGAKLQQGRLLRRIAVRPKKKSGGLRPITVGSVYRQLASRIGARHLASTLGAELRPTQLGVGTPLGCEAAVHGTRRFTGASRDTGAAYVLVKIDVSNAFNTVRRDVFLARIRERCPEVYHLAYQAYSAPTPLVIGGQTITSASGVQQGDPLGPAAFALAVDPCARAVTAPLNVWYLDDGTIAGPAATIAADLGPISPIANQSCKQPKLNIFWNIFQNIFSKVCVQSMQVILFGCTTCIYAALDYA